MAPPVPATLLPEGHGCKLSAEAEAWVRQFGDIVSKKFEYHVVGFVR
jgi:hypothetical protein